MSIPLDRLYHYIESVANEISDGDTIIYRFYPHGSKKIEDLSWLHNSYSDIQHNLSPLVICNDQEPLNFNLYKDIPMAGSRLFDSIVKVRDTLPRPNLRWMMGNIYDKCVLLHSEQRSNEVIEYQKHDFVPVYYWSHALIALDWFRYAQYHNFNKVDNKKTKFLIYNRAWAGTREYRIKFLEKLLENNLQDYCKVTFNPHDPESGVYYKTYQFNNSQWKSSARLEDHFSPTYATSSASADFDIDDYQTTDIEVVLETLFDDSRIHLTEKTLRPIACCQPFIIVGPAGSLEYLRNYGFKTFNTIIDESYDNIENPLDRMESIINTLQTISQWSTNKRCQNIQKMQEICRWNQTHFFSANFFNTITNELKSNLDNGLREVVETNTSKKYFNLRKQLATDTNLQDYWSKSAELRAQYPEKLKTLQLILSTARNYYNDHRNK